MSHSKFLVLCLCPVLLTSLFVSSLAFAEYQDPGVLDVVFDTTPVVMGGQSISESDIFRRSTMIAETKTGEICSGTLIASDILLIAAHCIVNAESKVFQVSGSIDGKKFSTVSIGSRTHEKYKKHPVFFGLGGHSNSNDIGLLRLRDKFPAQFIPASLPMKELNYKNQDVIIAGYGFTEGLRKGDVGVPYFGYTQVSSVSDESIVLVQEGNALTCPGDSGGPVYTVSGNSLVVIGVHSWGNCSRGIANSESVGQHLLWLQTKILELRSLKAL